MSDLGKIMSNQSEETIVNVISQNEESPKEERSLTVKINGEWRDGLLFLVNKKNVTISLISNQKFRQLPDVKLRLEQMKRDGNHVEPISSFSIGINPENRNECKLDKIHMPFTTRNQEARLKGECTVDGKRFVFNKRVVVNCRNDQVEKFFAQKARRKLEQEVKNEIQRRIQSHSQESDLVSTSE